MARARSAMLLLMVALLLPVAAAAPGVAAPGTSTVVAKVKVGGQPCGVVGYPHGIWIADYAGNRLVRIDPATGAVGGEVVGVRQTCEITYTHGAVWAPSRTGSLTAFDRSPARSRRGSRSAATSTTSSPPQARSGSSRMAAVP